MNKEVALYISGQRVDLPDDPAIRYNWTEDDLTNPTLTKVGYSKTVSLPSTKNNDAIFSQIWNLERRQTYGSDDFNPSYRVPFSLYVNGSIFEKGYVKLQNIVCTGSLRTYEVGLFGGLGSFLYNLSTDWNTGEEKTLGDLQYFRYRIQDEEWGMPKEPIDLGFTITKETVKNCWDGIWTYGNKGTHLNFAPCYNGINDNLDSNKGIINAGMNGASLYPLPDLRILSGTTIYTPYNGYAMASLPDTLTEWETKDIRSWGQRPCVRVKSIIDALSRKENNTGKFDDGYEVVLDEEFFNSDNPYYDSAWLTCPLLTELSFNDTDGTHVDYDSACTLANVTQVNDTSFIFSLPSAITDYGAVLTAKFKIGIKVTGATEDILFNSYGRFSTDWGVAITYKNIEQVHNAYAVQVLSAIADSGGTSSYLAGSDIAWCTHDYCYDEPTAPFKKFSYTDAVNAGYYQPKRQGAVKSYNGWFERSGSTDWFYFTKEFEFTCDLPRGANAFIVNIQRVNNSGSSSKATKLWGTDFTIGKTNSYQRETSWGTSTTKNVVSAGTFYSEVTDAATNFWSGRKVTQQNLLSTPYTPAKFLMDYCKMFGLYIHKDIYEDKIYIDTRNTFYRRNHVVDISNDIDIEDNFTITPLVCDAGWYQMRNEMSKSAAVNNYESKYGKTYGCKMIDTGYEFDADTKQLIDSSLKGGVEFQDGGLYYFKPYDEQVQPFMYNGITYTFYKNGSISGYDTGTTLNINFQKQDIPSYLQPLTDRKYYDRFHKPQFCDENRKAVDGANVLLFFTGWEDVTGLDYILSDDLDVMARLNGNPCHLISSSEVDSQGVQICIKLTQMPKFSRYYTVGGLKNTWYSMDWGSPRQLYIQDYVVNEQGNLYYHSYRKYLEDLYDVNTRIVNCSVRWKSIPTEDSLRDVYWFDNCYWRLNKIIDYDPLSDGTVRCEFVKVNDVKSLTNISPSINPTAEVTFDRTSVPYTGGVVNGHVETSDGGPWTIETWSYDEEVTVEPSHDATSGNFIVTIGPWSGYTSRDIVLHFRDRFGDYTITQEADTAFRVDTDAISAASGASAYTVYAYNTNSVIINPSSVYQFYTTTYLYIYGSNKVKIDFNVYNNPDISPRSQVITITDRATSASTTLTLTQAAASGVWSVSPTAITGVAAYLNNPSSWNQVSGTDKRVIISNPQQYEWDITQGSWSELMPASGTSGAELTLYVKGNPDYSARTETIYINDATNGGSTGITITQNAKFDISVSPSAITAGSGGTTVQLTINDPQNVRWGLIRLATWYNISPLTGNTSGTATLTIEPNTTYSSRTAYIYVSGSNEPQRVQTITITQDAATHLDPTVYTVQGTLTNYGPTGIYGEWELYWDDGLTLLANGDAAIEISYGNSANYGDINESGLTVPAEWRGTTKTLDVEVHYRDWASGDVISTYSSQQIYVEIPETGDVTITLPNFTVSV